MAGHPAREWDGTHDPLFAQRVNLLHGTIATMRLLSAPFRRHWFFAILLAAVTVLTYASSLGNEFVGWDDGLLITENTWIAGLNWENVKHVFTSYDPELYVPLSLLSYQINYALGELNPFGYHLFNLILHIANALLVALLTLKLSRKGWVAVFCGALFALHPLHTEAVAWASARKDVLSAFFALASMVSYLRYADERKRFWLFASALLFALGLMAKVSIILLPLALLLMAWYRNAGPKRSDVLYLVPHFLLSLLFGIVALGGKLANTGFLWDKFLMGCKAIGFYLGKILWPADFSVLYPYTDPISILTPDLLMSVLLVAALTALSVWALRFGKTPFFAWSFFLLFVIPSFANIAKGHNELLDVYFASDRYAYLPSIAAFYILGLGFATVRDKRTKLALLGAIAVALAMLSYRQSTVWEDSHALFTNVAAVQPNSYVAYTNLGTILVQEGQVDEGLELYRKSLAIRDDATTHYNVGQILEYQEKPDEALEHYRKAVASSPLHKEAWVRMGVILGQRGDMPEAFRALREALQLDPDDENLRLTIEELER
jgi:protein O-mannosyl-transferase